MANKVTPPINSFNAGEVSPLLDARTDLNKYGSGCRTLENAFPMVEGGAKKMPGTYYITGTPGKARLVSFSFSTDQSFVIEFSLHKIRIFDHDGVLQTITTAGDSAIDYDPATLYAADDVVSLGTTFWCQFGNDYNIATGKMLFVTSPYGVDPGNFFIVFIVNTSDSLVVSKIGNSPYQYILVKLANTTASKNTAALIQAEIRILAAMNGVDLTHFTVTPSPGYYAAPVTSFSGYGWTQINSDRFGTSDTYFKCLASNQYCYYPAQQTAKWEEDPTYVITPSGSTDHLDTIYEEADLFDLDVSTQQADVLYICHRDYPTRRLERHASNVWTLTTPVFLGTQDISKTGYLGIARPIKSITTGATTTIICPNHGFAAGDTIYMNHCLGMLEINQAQVAIATITDTDTFTVAIDSTNFGEYISGGWCVKVVEKFNAVGEYAACCTIFEQRLILAGFRNYPLRVCGSVVGDYHNFVSDPELDDYSLQFDLNANKIDPIKWLISQDKLALGTDSGINVMAGASGAPLTQSSIDTKRQITIGASGVAPQIINDSIIWFSRVARVARLLQYSWSNDQWIAPDLTRVARHITIGADQAGSGVVQTAYQAEPFPILWAVRKDGQLLGMTFESQEQVYAWFRVVTDGLFESICVIPVANDEDRVFVVVKRFTS
jgi:hypothetical protein